MALGAALGVLAVLPARASDSRQALEDEVAALRDRVAQLEGLVAAAGLRDPQGSRLLRASRPELHATVYGFLTS